MTSVDAGTSSAVKETVRRFITSSINVAQLDDDANLFESGIVNSLFAVQLMTFIEPRAINRHANADPGATEKGPPKVPILLVLV